MLNKKDSIEFPLEAFNQLIDVGEKTFDMGLHLLSQGAENYSWCMEWVNAQNKQVVQTE